MGAGTFQFATSGLLVFLGASLACSFVLVLVFRWDERFDRTSDLESKFLFPILEITTSVVKLAIVRILLAAMLASWTPFVWREIGQLLGWRQPGLADLKWTEYVVSPLFFDLALGWTGAVFIFSVFRCLDTPLRDLFISYKSEDVVLARRIADALTAAGWRVWFAEYQVLLAGRGRFRAAIRDAIRGTRFGFAITNDRWALSDHCAFEIKTLLRQLGPSKVIELRAPPQPLSHQRYPRLGASPSSAANDLPAILAFAKQAAAVSLPTEAPPPARRTGKRYEARVDGRPCSLLVEGWSFHRSGAPADGLLGGQTWKFDGLPEGVLFANVHWGHEVSHEGQRIDQAIDDRQMFDALVKWAPSHVDRLRARIRGVHLLFHSGLSQMGLTYWIRPQRVEGPMGPVEVGGTWHRKVSLAIPNRSTGRTAEFVFTFGFRGRFADYCRHAHIMDAFALSLDWS